MNFEFYKPTAPLDAFVDCFFSFEGLTADHVVERFIPDGNVELLIDLKEGPQFVYDNDSFEEIQSCKHVWTSGLRTKPITIPAGDNSSMIVVSFRKGLAYPFFPFPMDEIRDSIVDADLIWNSAFSDLRESLLESKSAKARFSLVEHHLLGLLRGFGAANSCVSFAINQLTESPMATSLSELSNKIGYSQKHFISMFRKCVGVTPKAYQKIMRFRTVISEIQKEEEPQWSKIALNCGFYDQAHFINDFRRFSGSTPSEYAAVETEDPSYIPIR